MNLVDQQWQGGWVGARLAGLPRQRPGAGADPRRRLWRRLVQALLKSAMDEMVGTVWPSTFSLPSGGTRIHEDH